MCLVYFRGVNFFFLISFYNGFCCEEKLGLFLLYSYSKCGEFRPLVPNQLKYNHLSLDFFFLIKGASLQEVDVKIEDMSRFDTV